MTATTGSTSIAATLKDKIETRQATFGVIGLGYVGLPLATAFAEVGFPVLGFDVNQQTVDTLNSGMPEYWVDKVWQALNEQGKSVKGSKILVVGVAYKPDIDDTRESPALDIIALLQAAGADVSYHDPYVPELEIGDLVMQSVELDEGVGAADAVVVATDHKVVNAARVRRDATLVVDTRSARTS